MDVVAIAPLGWRIVLTDDVRVVDRQGTDVTPRLRKARAIIAVLASAAECRMLRSELLSLLWSDRGVEQARASLRQCLFTLRIEVPALVEADFEWVWLAGTAVTPSNDEQAHASLARIAGVDPALDRWLEERRFAPATQTVDHVEPVERRQSHREWLVGIASVALVAAFAGWWSQHWSPEAKSPLIVIGIAPFAATPATGGPSAVASQMGSDIRALLPSDRAQVRISGGDRPDQASGLGAEWVISGSVDAREGAGKVRVEIATADGRMIWGRDVNAAPGRLSDAGAIAATRLAMATGCALGGPRVHRSVDVLGLLFAACERLDFSADNYNDETALVTLRRLADLAPDDALAQAYFGTGLAVLAYDMPPNLAEVQRVEAARRLDLALRLDPRVGEAWIGRFALVRDERAYAMKESLLLRGLAVDRDNPMLNSFLGSALFSVGRSQEGLVFVQRAAAIAPAFLAPGQHVAGILSATGRPREALAFLDVSDRRFPRNARQAMQRLDVLLTSGDTRAARSLLDHAAEIPGFLEPEQEAFERRLTFAMDAPRGVLAQAVARDAVADAEVKPDFAPRDFNVLTQLGRTDAAIALALRHPMPPDVFFRQQSRQVLLNPQFPVLARRVGLWDYWQRTGHWPDICRDPQRLWACGAIKSASFPR